MKAAVAAIFLVSLSAHAQFACGPGSEDCYLEHEAPGCLQPECCNLICADDLYCCEVTWDATCVKLAEGLCGEVYCPNWEPCDVFHASGGCLDEACCEHVRLHDPFCGWGIWDETCVAEAAALCGVDACEIEPPMGALLENESCLERTNDGCSLAEPAWMTLPCGYSVYGTCVTSVPRDTDWVRLAPTILMRYTFTLRPEFPARMLLVDGVCSGPHRTIEVRAIEPCSKLAWTVDLSPGEWFLIVDAGNDRRTIRGGLPCDEIDPDDPPKKGEDPPPSYYGLNYVLSLDCEPLEELTGDLNGDGAVNGIDLGLFLAAWGDTEPNSADFNGDGVVDGIDLGLMLANWEG